MLITYINCHQKLCKSALRYQAEALDLKLWIEHVRCDQRRNVFQGTNSFFKCTPRLIFAAGWIGHVCCKKTRNRSRGTNSCIKCTSILVFASIKEYLELLVNFMNNILIHKTFKAIIYYLPTLTFVKSYVKVH